MAAAHASWLIKEQGRLCVLETGCSSSQHDDQQCLSSRSPSAHLPRMRPHGLQSSLSAAVSATMAHTQHKAACNMANGQFQGFPDGTTITGGHDAAKRSDALFLRGPEARRKAIMVRYLAAPPFPGPKARTAGQQASVHAAIGGMHPASGYCPAKELPCGVRRCLPW